MSTPRLVEKEMNRDTNLSKEEAEINVENKLMDRLMIMGSNDKNLEIEIGPLRTSYRKVTIIS